MILSKNKDMFQNDLTSPSLDREMCSKFSVVAALRKKGGKEVIIIKFCLTGSIKRESLSRLHFHTYIEAGTKEIFQTIYLENVLLFQAKIVLF